MKQAIQKIDYISVRYNIYLYLSIIFAVFIFLGSVTPETGSGVVKNSGFLAHMFSYFVLSSAILLYLSGKSFQKPFIKSALLAGTYGLFIEFIQFFISYRHFEVLDILINFSGAFLILLFLIFNKKLKNLRIR